MAEEKRQNWTRTETEIFLKALQEADVVSALNGKKTTKCCHFFSVCQTCFPGEGVNKPWKALRNKWKTMKARFLVEKRESGRSGAGGEKKFEYWEEMDTLLGSRPVATAISTTIDSSTVSPDEDLNLFDGVEDNDDDAATVCVDENAMDTPVTPAAVGGSGLFRRPLKQKVTPSQQLNDKISELLRRHERQEESDREMLQSLVSSVNRLVDCMEKQQTGSQMPAAPFPYSHPGPSTYHHQSFLYVQHQQQQDHQQQQSYPSTSSPHLSHTSHSGNVCVI